MQIENEMQKDLLLKNSLKLLKVFGVDLHDKGFFKIVKRLLNFVVFFMVFVDLVLIVFYNWKGFDTIIEDQTTHPVTLQSGYKLTSMLLKERHYLSAFRKISKFTKWEDLNGVIKRDIDDRVKRSFVITKCYILCVIGVLIGYGLAPLWIDFEGSTPFDTYFSKYFDNTVFYLAFFIFQEIELVVGATNRLIYDIMYISVITNINIEIRIMKHQIERIADNENKNCVIISEIYKLIAQHNEILGVIKKCAEIFSDALFVQFLTSTLVLSTGLFAIADSGFPPSMYVLIKFGSHFSAGMAQLFLFCTLGQNLINETQSIADAIYNIKWWIKPQPDLRRACLLIIQRANKLDCLNAAGIFVVDYKSYTQVVKFGASLFTVLRAMKSKTSNF